MDQVYNSIYCILSVYIFILIYSMPLAAGEQAQPGKGLPMRQVGWGIGEQATAGT